MTKISAWEMEFDRLVRVGHLRAVDDLARKRVEDLDPGNPNHPINDGIFGYETRAFLARQNKES